MTYLSSLPDGAVLVDVFRAYPEAARPLLAYHEVLLRGPSPLTVAERELIAAPPCCPMWTPPRSTTGSNHCCATSASSPARRAG